ncbi:MAG: site-specific integrase [Rhodoblastus sp.]
MRESVHTPDTVYISGPTFTPPDIELTDASTEFAVNCTSVAAKVRALVEDSVSPATRRAHASDLRHFAEWGGSIPAAPETIAEYLADHAGELTVSTLTRRAGTLSKAHAALGLPSPCQAQIVRSTLQGLRRRYGVAGKQARALVLEDLFPVLDGIGDDAKGVRDRALLLLGFAGGFRRSELVGLDAADIEHVRQGVVVHLRRSKTDQHGAGRKIGIPHGRSRHCPVSAIDRWIEVATASNGPIFRPVDRHGHIAAGRLSGDAVSDIVKERVAAVGLDPDQYSGHSLRSGFATSAARVGVSTLKIRAQTGHTTDAMLARYVRDGELFVGNAAGALL